MSELRPALISFLLLTVITGVVYPLAVTGLGQALFSDKANGSLIRDGDRLIGSQLIGQPFLDPRYFFGRPSATAPQPYNGAASSGSNQGPTNPALATAISARVAALRAFDPENKTSVPIDLVTASGSGLDPHISPAAAEYQVPRVARMRNRPESEIRTLVKEMTEGRTFGILGEPRVNVLLLNLALDGKQAG
ncbi:potassium-transporting ATPase KdpC subunit [Steroidobacter agaridevorans]|uniref:Potassium-transporting ATPase KdpC subunit n=1 Tax=Steroidobacter agaridevorans TaxID=2695856 RepID=A0A829YAY2_9GAMM|nr:potassium-transporting ATPase subunit KdpC [Steroidobacter agaridevorans]GFE79998.1 potassium-transporting ATPase KdpC subunit [Steroidobacter agaridevorans]GFE90032.1 potassium-transporting ATPase KdpC subunit [Steroidobacter agaridevorans]